MANSAVPCIEVTPGTLYNFGAQPVSVMPAKFQALIHNCGPVALVVSGIAFAEDPGDSTEFSADLQALYTAGKLASPPPVSASNALRIGVGQTQTVWVSYTPADYTPDLGQPDHATLVFSSNAVVVPKLQLTGVGIHYWNDHGFGISKATVSIYVQGNLSQQFASVPLKPLDMWYVGKINWPNTVSGGTAKVFETCHQTGQSCPAGKNLMWQPTGDWCITPCYGSKSISSLGSPGACKP